MSDLSLRSSLSALAMVGAMLVASSSAAGAEAPSLDAYAGEAAILGSPHRGHAPPGAGASHESRGSGGSSAQRSGFSGSAGNERSQTGAGRHIPPSSTSTSGGHGSRSTSTTPRPERSTEVEATSSDAPLLSSLDILLLLITCAGLLCAGLVIRGLAHRPQ